eukprot:SAG31_NODE_20770_length_565_cov_1.759657_1_plen_51_part_10
MLFLVGVQRIERDQEWLVVRLPASFSPMIFCWLAMAIYLTKKAQNDAQATP